jgi:hypothetical protein
MYSIDDGDEVVETKEIPFANPGAPELVVFATDGRVVLSYGVPGLDVGQRGPDGRMLLPEDIPPGYDPVALVEFEMPRAHLLGPPNDEAIEGHPLASRGLRPYGTYEIKNSSWIRSLERMNRVHPMHRPARYSRLRHFVITFHDSTFECIAEGVRSRVFEQGHPELVVALHRLLQD